MTKNFEELPCLLNPEEKTELEELGFEVQEYLGVTRLYFKPRENGLIIVNTNSILVPPPKKKPKLLYRD